MVAAANGQERGSSCDANVNVLKEKFTYVLGKAIDANKKYGLELQAFYVLDIEYADFLLLSYISPLSTADDLNIVNGQEWTNIVDESVDTLFAVDKYCD